MYFFLASTLGMRRFWIKSIGSLLQIYWFCLNDQFLNTYTNQICKYMNKPFLLLFASETIVIQLQFNWISLAKLFAFNFRWSHDLSFPFGTFNANKHIQKKLFFFLFCASQFNFTSFVHSIAPLKSLNEEDVLI